MNRGLITAGGVVAAAGLFFAAYRSYQADKRASHGTTGVGAPLGSNPNGIPPYQAPNSPQIA